jgi:hypothetical protein
MSQTQSARYEICLQRCGVYAIRETGRMFGVVEPFRGTRDQAIELCERMNDAA